MKMLLFLGGYISKRQKVGQFELKQSAAAMPLMHTRLAKIKQTSASSHLARVINRLFTQLEGKGILRSGVEEFLLAAGYLPHDELAAEFIRTFQHRFFLWESILGSIRTITAEGELQHREMHTEERCQSGNC